MRSNACGFRWMSLTCRTCTVPSLGSNVGSPCAVRYSRTTLPTSSVSCARYSPKRSTTPSTSPTAVGATVSNPVYLGSATASGSKVTSVERSRSDARPPAMAAPESSDRTAARRDVDRNGSSDHRHDEAPQRDVDQGSPRVSGHVVLQRLEHRGIPSDLLGLVQTELVDAQLEPDRRIMGVELDRAERSQSHRRVARPRRARRDGCVERTDRRPGVAGDQQGQRGTGRGDHHEPYAARKGGAPRRRGRHGPMVAPMSLSWTTSYSCGDSPS